MNKKIIIAVASVSMVLIGAVAGWHAYDEYQHSVVNVAMKAVRAKLFDGDSANFRNVREINKSGWVCGEVNAKNRFGAYVGFNEFATLGATRTPANPDPVPTVIMHGNGEKIVICEGR